MSSFASNFKRAAGLYSAALLALLALGTPGVTSVQASSVPASRPSVVASHCQPGVSQSATGNHTDPECQSSMNNAQQQEQAAEAKASSQARATAERGAEARAEAAARAKIGDGSAKAAGGSANRGRQMGAARTTVAVKPGGSPGNPPADCSGVSQIPLAECQVLIALYQSTNGGSWTNNSGWNTTTPCTTPWYGVTCTSGHITDLELSGNHLVGSIPSTLANLTALTTFNVYANALTGSIPTLPVGLVNLYADGYADGSGFHGNTFTGSIPTLSTSLQQLQLDGNALTGALPTLPNGMIGVG